MDFKLELTPKKNVLFIMGDQNSKVGSQEIPGVQASLDSEYMKQGKGNRVLPRECTGDSKHTSNNTRDDSTHGNDQIINTKIRLIIFFAGKDGETLHSQQKQDWELTVAQIMNPLFQNSDLN